MENKWPPLKECAQYRCGMLPHYLQKFYWEEEDDEGNVEYEYGSDSDDEKVLITIKRSSLKEFLKQVRTTRGYDVNLRLMRSPFWNLKPKLFAEFHIMLSKSIEAAINYIYLKSGKVYKHVDTLKVVHSPHRLFLLTFTAKIADSGEQATFTAKIADSGEQAAADSGEQTAEVGVQTFLATVFAPTERAPIEEYKVRECFLKPEGPAPWNYIDLKAASVF